MNLFRTQRKTPGQEHGDWRLPLEKPAETEHLPPREPTVWRKMRLRARYLQAMPVGADSTYASEEAEGTSSLAPIAGWSRFVRLMLAWLILLPLSILLTYALLLHLYRAGDTVGQREFWLSVPVWYSLLGAGAFISLIVARIATPILVYIYVLGHELTHAIAAIICLGRVQTLRIGLDGGYVETDTDNLFIALSPYFVPLWMGCWMVALWCSNLACPFPEWEAWFYAGFGFWWSFHLYWTAWVIPREQPDMLENGLLFSLLLVVILNVGILLGVLYCFGLLSPVEYGRDFLDAAQQLLAAFRDFVSWMQRAFLQ